MRSTFAILAVMTCGLLPTSASAYLMQMQSYSNMFERADVVVIATPLDSQQSKAELTLQVEQPKSVTDLITTVDTEFQIAYVLKGKIEKQTIHFLHLNRKDKAPFVGSFGAVGTFFIDFDTEKNKRKSYILFMSKRNDGAYCPAWRPMEGSRAIVAVEKDGEL